MISSKISTRLILRVGWVPMRRVRRSPARWQPESQSDSYH
jgi:hypothetical protein